jgi:hypothetical protein
LLKLLKHKKGEIFIKSIFENEKNKKGEIFIKVFLKMKKNKN